MTEIRKNYLEYNEIMKKMIQIMNQFDPEGLIKLGAPDDEYHSEVEIIYSYLFGSGRPVTLDEFISFSYWVFNYRFSGNFKWKENPKVKLFCEEVYNMFIENIKV